MRFLAGLAVAAAVALTSAGAAFADPPGVALKDGAFIAPDGKPLYTFARDTTPGKSACNGGCAASWHGLAAAATDKDAGDWTVVTRDDGAKQWAYKGKPLYTFARDTAGAAATGVSAAWPLATK
jgi:predicted lipoprotein with Yx(FWY)xxD motif